MRRLGALLAAMPLAFGAVACDADGGGANAPVLRAHPLSSPTGQGSAQPSLALDERGRALLTWLASADSGATLRMAVLRDSGWSEPRTIAAGRDFIVNWADFPSAAAFGDGRMAAHWLEREGIDTYAYGVRVAFSEDGGESWGEPVRPHRDSTETEHGFVSMLPAADGVAAIWLDGRNFAAGRPDMTLRTAHVSAGSIDGEAVLDDRICDCCQTDAAATPGGAVVVYRDRSADEIRDIAVVRQVHGAWSSPRPVHVDGWRIDGCPVNGPAVAAEGERVAVAWYTAARDTAKVLLAFSRDGGATFEAPVRVDEGRPAGRVDVVMADDERAVVSWIEQDGDGAATLRMREIAMEGAPARSIEVAPVSASRAAGFPRMVLTGEAIVIAWTDVDAGTVRTARIALR